MTPVISMFAPPRKATTTIVELQPG